MDTRYRRLVIIIFLFIASFANLAAKDKAYYNEIKDSISLKNGQYTIVIFQNTSNCIKCYLELFSLVDALLDEFPNRFIPIAIVDCDRQIELKQFYKQTQWRYKAIINDGSCEKLGLDQDCELAIFDSEFNLLYSQSLLTGYKGKKIIIDSLKLNK